VINNFLLESKIYLMPTKLAIFHAFVRAVDHQRTLMYWHIRKRIFEEVQQSKDWADYGRFLVKYLSEHLQPEFGSDSSDFSMVNFTILFRLCMHCMHN